jgi:hypothetical protein
MSKETKGTGYVISAAVGVFWISLVWIVIYCKFKRYTRYVFVAFYVGNVILEILVNLSDEKSALYAMRGMEVGWVSLTIYYLINTTAASYCEFYICTLLYTPLYLLGTYYISEAS